MARPSRLPAPAEELVLSALQTNKQPLSALAILDKVNQFGINSSTIVYRALDLLIKNGTVHKINELNSFVACNCDDDHHHEVSILTVCRDCKRVDELHGHDVIHHFSKLRSFGVNLVKSAIVELPVICDRCALELR